MLRILNYYVCLCIYLDSKWPKKPNPKTPTHTWTHRHTDTHRETKVNLPSQQLAKNISLQVPERLQCLSLQKVGGDVEETLLSI